LAQLEDERGLAAAHRPADPDGKSALAKIASEWTITPAEGSWANQRFVGVAMIVKMVMRKRA
jgi:hypothetical protein